MLVIAGNNIPIFTCMLYLFQVVPTMPQRGVGRPNNALNERNMLIRMYFNQGYTTMEIQGFLLPEHGYFISLRHLYRILSSMGLRRHLYSSNFEHIIVAIHNELQPPSCNLGYRFMRLRLAE